MVLNQLELYQASKVLSLRGYFYTFYKLKTICGLTPKKQNLNNFYDHKNNNFNLYSIFP